MKLVIGITGASGALYAKILAEKISKFSNIISDVGIVFSPNAKEVWMHELQEKPEIYWFTEYEHMDFYAAFASGSAQYDAMVICPCSMGTLGKIAHGVSDNLITRAADVMLKERKKLILVPRETPLNLIHIKNMELLTLAGGIICPANPSLYSRPQTITEMCETVVDRVIHLLGIECDSYKWGEK